jgi:peptidoglycan hydrolase-like protein with peptidoglycan-binding domain
VPDPEALPLTLPTLRVGSRGFYVEMVQVCLKFPPHECDGEFGGRTKAALQQFQRDHGLSDDGVVAPYTWKELIRPWAEEVELIGRTPPVRIT